MTTQAASDDIALTVRVAEEIRGLMGRRNLSRVKLAQQLGQSRTYLGRRLSGETAFDLDDLEAIARVFGVPVAALLGVVPMTPRPVPPSGGEGLTVNDACSPGEVATVTALSRPGRAA